MPSRRATARARSSAHHATGSPTTAHNLAVITGPLREISRRPDACVELIGVNGDAPLSIPYDSLPWQPATALVLADVANLDAGHSPVRVSPRQVLRAQLDRAAERGWTARPVPALTSADTASSAGCSRRTRTSRST